MSTNDLENGLFVNDDKSGPLKAFSHNGHNPGWHATSIYFTEQGKGLVLMLNTHGAGALMAEAMYAVGAAHDFPPESGMRATERAAIEVSENSEARRLASGPSRP